MLTPILTFSLLWIFVSSADVHILVQPTGSDSNDGIHHPVKTIEKAISRLNDADVKGNNVFIEVRKGVYDLKKTITFPRDFDHSITLRSFYNKEPAYIVGGKRLSANLFHPVTDTHVLQQLPAVAHSKVRQLKFADAGISLSQLGHLERFGFAHQRTAEMEITFNGKALRLARWPNDDHYLNVESCPDGKLGSRFTYPTSVGSRAEKWRHESDMWVYGFWFWSWADDSASVASVDPAHHTITLHGTKLWYGMRKGHISLGNRAGYSQQGGYFRVFNALCELDQGGEYYIDRKAGILYLWPPTQTGALSSHDVVVGSMLDNLVSLSHQSNIHIQDLSFESSRHFGITGDSISSCTFQRLEIKNTGSYGMHVYGNNLIIRQCDIHDTDGGVATSGGDRKTLHPSEILIENNHIWDFSRAAAVQTHGVSLGGVGIRVQYNEISGGKYTGVMFSGNDHLIKLNNLHHLCYGSSDCGAIHAGRDWTNRGVVIQQNHIYNVLRNLPGAEVRGVMLDDQLSSVLIEGNVFHDNEVHFNIGGGRDNIARFNVFFNARSCAVDVDGRGIAGASTSNDKTLHDKLKSVPYSTGIWAQKYPKLARIDSEAPGEPRGNQVYNNVIYHGISRNNFNYHGAFLRKPGFFNMHDNFENTQLTYFNDRAHGDYRVVCAAAAWATQNNFTQPPTLAEVGPHLPVGPSFKHGTVVTKTNGPLKHSC